MANASSGAQSGSDIPSGDRVVSESRLVPAPASAIFDLLADPSKHCEFDGSGTVRAAQSNAPARLRLGAKFGMEMKLGAAYKITNEVVEFEENRRIAWRHFGGHIWRYILEPADGGTVVTEQFDWRKNKSPLMIRVLRLDRRNRSSIVATLERLAARFS